MTTKTQHLIHHHKLWRLLEIIPGTIAWTAIIAPLILSIYKPNLVASFIIIYTVIWLFRSIKLSINLYKSFKISKKALKTDWLQLINLNDYPEKINIKLKQAKKLKSKEKYNELLNLKNTIKKLKDLKQWKKSKEIYHTIIFVTYKEPYQVIEESIKSYANSNYNTKKIILVIGGEESDKENFIKITNKIQKNFKHKFKKIIITIHPKNIPGEIKGKSANATYTAKQFKKYADKEKIPYENIIISNFDADTVVHKNYFAELTFKYLTTEDRTIKAFQPTHLFHNNIWNVPIMNRIVAQSCSYWRMAESMEKDKYKSFSSRSISFKAVVEVDYWDPAIIPEDSRQYWTAYLIYNGKHKVIPIFTPVYMDAVLSETYIKTFKSQYNQLKRWAWGVSDFPFIAINLWHSKNFSITHKIYKTYEFLENSFFWATGPILITFMGFIPGIINPNFNTTVLAYNVPKIMSNTLTISSIGIIVCAIISLNIVPRTSKQNIIKRTSLALQWLLVPIVSIFLSAIPALDAQTKLLLGKRMEYKVTEKARK